MYYWVLQQLKAALNHLEVQWIKRLCDVKHVTEKKSTIALFLVCLIIPNSQPTVRYLAMLVQCVFSCLFSL